MRYASVLLLVLGAAPALAQPMSITASAAVTWISAAVQEEPSPDLTGQISMGNVHHPAVVVVWRGQPGWMFKDDTPESANTLSFSSASEYSRPTLDPIYTINVTQGAVRLELAYDYATQEVRVNGTSVRLPDGHDVVLVDDVDEEAVIVDTLRVSGSEPEWVEVFLGRSDRVREFVRCDVPLPEGTFNNERFRRGMQRTLNERCEMMNRSPSAAAGRGLFLIEVDEGRGFRPATAR